MNETQKLIKSVIENETKKLYGIEVIVEYVSDVSARILELQQSGANFNSVYDAEYCTGAFIPTVNDNPYYILIQKDRKSMLDVMTAFHEFKHLIDYVMFLKAVFNNNTELLKNSPLYITFNVYSEYSATLYGIEKYIETVRIEDTSQKELAKSVFENSKAAYCNAQKIDNKYQLLVHSMQYVASIVACSKFIDELDIQVLISKMELSEELYPVINHIFMYKNENDWYYELDKIMRNFVDGGV